MHAHSSPIDSRERTSRRQMLSTAAGGFLMVALCGAFTPVRADEAAKPFLGGWDLTIPGGGAGWLGVTEKGDQLKAEILWGGGSVEPVTSAKVEHGNLVITRSQKSGNPSTYSPVTITAQVDGDKMGLVLDDPGKPDGKHAFYGKRTPPLPPTPDLSKVKYGDPIVLFNGKDLTGWKPLDSRAPNGWSVQDGVMTNTVVQEPGQPHKAFANLRTEREFEDFNITLETRVPKAGNSGVYLRGIYEVQVFDSFGKKLDPHNMGAIYSRICPTVAAEKPVGEWQTLDITLVDRHATVILNGTKIIDNQPLLGCTGGALWADQLKPGPIYLQGDHTGIEYRNIVLRPVVK
jgi:hypothetical protein